MNIKKHEIQIKNSPSVNTTKEESKITKSEQPITRQPQFSSHDLGQTHKESHSPFDKIQ